MAGSRLDALFEMAKDFGSFFKKVESAKGPKVEPTLGASRDGSAEPRPTAAETPAFVPPEAAREAVSDILGAPDSTTSHSVAALFRDKSGSVKLTKAERKAEEKIARSIDQYTRRQIALGRDPAKVTSEAAQLERNMRAPAPGSSGITGGQAALGGGAIILAVMAALGQKTLSHGNLLGGILYDLNPHNIGKMYNAQQQTIAAQTAHLVPDIDAQTRSQEPDSWGKRVWNFFGLNGTPQKVPLGSTQVPVAAPVLQVPSPAPQQPPESTIIQQQPVDPATGCDPVFGCPPSSSKQHSELTNESRTFATAGGRLPAPPIRTVLASQSTIANRPEIVVAETKPTKSSSNTTQQRMTI